MKVQKLLAMILVACLTACILFGCAANDAGSDMIGNGQSYDGSEKLEPESGLTGGSGSISNSTTQNEKLVRKVWLEAETEDLDALLVQIDEKISQLSGYVEAREVYNGSAYATRRYRHASITIRIPADQIDAFVTGVSEDANITSSNETTDNITLTYVATQSRITALETEQTRLLELLAKAENMSDLLQIESRLTDVRTELEEVTSQLQLYDNQVDYGTIYLTLDEVREYTVTEEPETVWERIGTGFMENLRNLGDFFVELFIFVVTALPYLIPVALIVAAIILMLRRNRRKKKATPTSEE